MDQDDKKNRVAAAALELIDNAGIIGIGTGSTMNHFIDGLATIKGRFDAAVSSSEASSARLRGHGIEVMDLNSTGELDLYVDGADEATRFLHLLKGGGGALTREKVVAAASRRFVCIIDDSKLVERLGTFPLPVEVIPMARSYVARELVGLGGQPELRMDFVTDNGNQILDVHHMDILDPAALEDAIDRIAGVVSCGLFVRRPADLLLVASDKGVEEIR